MAVSRLRALGRSPTVFAGQDSRVDNRWYKDGLIYELSVRTFADSNGDGVGDFRGLAGRLDYLASLGVTAVWLSPFYASPWRDDGYDITDFYRINPDFGDLGDFVQFVEQAADRGIRVLIDLVLNHTSSEHPWFQAARTGDAHFRDYYVWADERPDDAESGIVFPGEQTTTWSYDRAAKAYYFHRFYDFQPDLNIMNPAVREEMCKVIGFWAQLGIAGFRVDAVPFLIEPISASDTKPKPDFECLHAFRKYLSWRSGDGVLLGEANVERDQVNDYYGVGGLHMLFNFPLNQHLWLALARQDARPILDALRETNGIPGTDQWATFLRNHDELDLGRLGDDAASVFARFGPKKSMQLYGRGIRRRLAPMLSNNRAQLELALSLLLTLPGTPVLYYGDELGMGEDISLRERESVRTPMQWSPSRNGGFSSAPRDRLCSPIISSGEFSYRSVNVADQQVDPSSLLQWFQRAMLMRRQCPEFARGEWEPLGVSTPSLLAIRYRSGQATMLALHNLSGEEARTRVKETSVVDVFANRDYPAPSNIVRLDGYGYRWLRAG
jgi:maltose alpha-D-glucosyltransferase / alpha-amylase